MTSLILPECSRQQAEISRWLGSGRYLTFTLQQQTVRLHLTRVTVTTPPESVSCLRTKGGVLRVVDRSALLRLLVDCPLLPGETDDTQHWYWDYLNQQFTPPVREVFGALYPQTAADHQQGMWLQATITRGSEQAGTLLYVPDALLMIWQTQKIWRAVQRASDPRLPLTLPLTMGKLTLSVGRCRQLAAGDVLVPTTRLFTPTGQGVMPWGRKEFDVQMEPDPHSDHSGILHIRSHKELTMTYPNELVTSIDESVTGHDAEAFWQESSSDSFQDLPLELTVRCGNLRLTLGELQQLDTGSTLLVEHVTPGEALLCHGNYPLAKGELVNVNGTLGLQIVSMMGHSGKLPGHL